LDESQIQTENLFAGRLIQELKRSGVSSISKIIDLRMLSGRVLAEIGKAFGTNTRIGFDLYSVNCDWARDQYGHQVEKYPVGDPIEFLSRWIDSHQRHLGEIDLILQSQSILSLTSDPERFLNLTLKLLRPGGIWASYEQNLDRFPRQIFLHELFDPWATQHFSHHSFLRLFSKKRISIQPGFHSSTRSVYLIRHAEHPYLSPELQNENILDKHPQFTTKTDKRDWYGPRGRIKTLAITLRHKAEERLRFGNRKPSLSENGLISTGAPIVVDPRPVVDVLIVSCGRLCPLQKTVAHFLKLCYSSTRRYRFIIHDDWIDSRAPAHEQCRNWIKQTRIFDEIHFAEENRGISRSVNFLLSRLQSDLYVHLEDDMVFIRPIDFDPLYQIFSDFPKVNQIRFNRTQTTPTIGAVSKIFGKYRARMFKFNETVLSMGSFWSNQAQIARSDSPFTRLMATVDGRFNERVFNIDFAKNWLDPLDSYTHLGTFMYGPIGAAKVVYEAGDVSPHSIIQQSYPEDNTLTIDRFRK